jgi:hypothetical protein
MAEEDRPEQSRPEQNLAVPVAAAQGRAAQGRGTPGGGGLWAAALAAAALALGVVILLFRGPVSPGAAERGTAAGAASSAGSVAAHASSAARAPTLASAPGLGSGLPPARAAAAGETAPVQAALQLVSVGGAAGDPALAEDVALFDPATLFLPTRWNSSYVAKTVREPGAAFAAYPPKPVFTESAPLLALPEPPVPASPAAALADDPPGVPLLGFGRTETAIPALAARGAFVEVVAAAGGRPVLAEALTAAAPPSDAPWQPMEFMAAVDAAGLVGPLVATLSSGAAPVDAYFRRYLADTVRIGARLAPGFYRISVGP